MDYKTLRHSKSETDRREALRLIADHLRAHPDDAEAWYDKASCHDFIGEEQEAEPCYQKVYDLGWRKLLASEQRSFFVGFGSTLRNNLHFEQSAAVLEEGIREFPDYPAFKIFLAFTRYSQKQDRAAAKLLFEAINQSGAKFDGYERAIQWYGENLDSHPEPRS